MDLERAKINLSAARISGDEHRLKSFVDAREAKIAELQQEINSRIAAFETAPDLIRRAEAAVARAEQEQLVQKNRRDVNQLKRLLAKGEA